MNAAPDGADGREPGTTPTEKNETEATASEETVEEPRARLATFEQDFERFDTRSGLTFAGAAAIRGSNVAGGHQYIHDQHIHLRAEAQSPPLTSPLPANLLAELAYAAVDHPSGDLAVATLRDRRLCIVQGPRGSGRKFLAHSAAWRVSGAKGCRLVAPHTGLTELNDGSLSEHAAYVLESPTIGSANHIDAFIVTSLTELLERYDARLVLVVDNTITIDDAGDDYLVTVTDGPERTAVLREQLAHHAAFDGPIDIDALVRDRALQTWLDAADPSLRDITAMARTLASGVPVDECMRQAPERVRAEARALLAAEDRPRELAIAVAFFGGLSYMTVRRLGIGLADRIHHMSGNEGPRQQAVLAERQERLDLIDAVVDVGNVETDYGNSPGEVIDFRRPHMMDAVIEQARRDFDGAELLLTWLGNLVTDDNPAVRTRAAGSIGWMARSGFADVVESHLQRWARSRDHRLRHATAAALQVAAQDERVVNHVCGLLSSWASRTPDHYERMTAAVSWGLAFGRSRPDVALHGLGRLLTTSDRDGPLNSALLTGLLMVFEAHPMIALRTWRVWIFEARGNIRRDILDTFIEACRTSSSDARSPRTPEVLRLIDRQGLEAPDGDAPEAEPIVDDVAALWQAALASRDHRDQAFALLMDWVRAPDNWQERPSDQAGEATESSAIAGLIRRITADDLSRRRVLYELRHSEHGREDTSGVSHALRVIEGRPAAAQ